MVMLLFQEMLRTGALSLCRGSNLQVSLALSKGTMHNGHRLPRTGGRGQVALVFRGHGRVAPETERDAQDSIMEPRGKNLVSGIRTEADVIVRIGGPGRIGRVSAGRGT